MGSKPEAFQLVTLLAALALGTPGAFAAGPLPTGAEPENTVAVPCAGREEAGNSVFRDCGTAKPDLQQRLTEQLRTAIRQNYGEMACTGGIEGRICQATCNLFKGDLNAMEEGNDLPPSSSSKNFLDQSCGDWAALKLKPVSANIAQGRTSDQCVITVEPKESASREAALIRGMWPHGLDCALKGVARELHEGRLSLSMGRGGASECARMREPLERAVARARTAFAGLQGSLAPATGAGKVAAGDALTQSCASTSEGGSGARQGACQLVAARSAIEAAFLQLAVCETTVRARRHHADYMSRFVHGAELQPIVHELLSSGRTCLMTADKGCDRRLAEDCYRRLFIEGMRAKEHQAWPAGSCE